MGYKTGITWTDATVNFWRGCKKVSPGCANCYMYRDQKRYGNNPEEIVRSKTTFNDPIKWAKSGKLKPGSKIFVCSWSDFFLSEADEWRDEAWKIIRDTPYIYQLCTKRPENIIDRLPKDWGAGYPNVWLGVTGENQTLFDRRAKILLPIPARIHWVSIEPQLEQIRATDSVIRKLDWVVIGGESGKDARLFNPQWIDFFAHLITPKLFVKQMGSNPVGLKLKHPHGADPSEWEEKYRIQEFPKEAQ